MGPCQSQRLWRHAGSRRCAGHCPLLPPAVGLPGARRCALRAAGGSRLATPGAALRRPVDACRMAARLGPDGFPVAHRRLRTNAAEPTRGLCTAARGSWRLTGCRAGRRIAQRGVAALADDRRLPGARLAALVSGAAARRHRPDPRCRPPAARGPLDAAGRRARSRSASRSRSPSCRATSHRR